MRKIIMTILTLPLLTITGCETPDYGSEKEMSTGFEITNGTEVASFNGYVVEVTEDNIIRIKVPKRGDLIQNGWTINEEGVIKVALASVMIPTENLPLSKETNAALKDILLNQEITVDVLEGATSSTIADTKGLHDLWGYIQLKDSDSSIQELLIKNGLAIIDKSSPFLEGYMTEFENLQTAAQNNTLGVWAIDGFVNLSSSFEGHFTNFADVNEAEIKSIIKEIKAKSWNIEKLIQK
ncbi:thermonuclease family protein [Lysinibacillus sp. UGB7]|uniref:thermonuclease family protein n=1 Tax=Lysinibacillus sp. UGB7 TaxID=3411039 RepID=UPI003B7FAB62